MTVPMWALLAFAAWTLFLLTLTVGVYRWREILAGRKAISGFPADPVDGADWYRRGTRAHANCIENLPVFGAIVVALNASGVGGSLVDYLSIGIVIARVCQSTVHVCLVQGNAAVAVRFSFFSVQLVSFMVLIAMIGAGYSLQ